MRAAMLPQGAAAAAYPKLLPADADPAADTDTAADPAADCRHQRWRRKQAAVWISDAMHLRRGKAGAAARAASARRLSSVVSP